MLTLDYSKFKCCVQGCNNNVMNSKGLIFVCLPTEPIKLSRWLSSIGREDLLQKSDLDEYRVCSVHFPDIVIKEKDKLLQINQNAIPTLHLPKKNCKRTEIQDFQQPSTSRTPSEQSVEVETIIHDDNLSNYDKAEKLDAQIETIDPCFEFEKMQSDLIEPRSENKILLEDCIRMISGWQNKLKFKQKSKGFNLYLLNTYLRSSVAYRFLQKFSTLPSYKSLKNTRIHLKPGLNDDLLSILSQRLKTSKAGYKYCVICLDKTELKSSMYYDIRNDEIIGLTECHGEKRKEMAKYAYVMLLKGFIENYRQPLGYVFLGEYIAKDLIILVKDTIHKLSDAGYVVKALVTPPTFNLAKALDVTVERPFFTVGQQKVCYVYDVPQLYRNICINLSDTDLFYEGAKLVSWKYLYTTYRVNLRRDINAAPRLSEAHLTPTPDMKIAHVTELISYEVAASISADIERGTLPKLAEETANFLIKMSQLFQFLNSSVISHSNKYKRAFCGEHHQVEYLKNNLDFLRTIVPVQKELIKSLEIKEVFDGLRMNINAILLLHSCFSKYGLKCIFTRRLNNNSIRFFFKELRLSSKKSTLTELTPIQFRRAFSKRTLLYLLKYSPTTFSKNDLNDILLFKLKLPFISHATSQTVMVVNTTDYRMKFPKKNLFVYICGYLLKACADRHTCPVFLEYKYQKNVDIFKDIDQLRELKSFNASSAVKILVPPKEFIRTMELYENIFVHLFEESVLAPGVGKKIFETLISLQFSNPCPCFPIEYLLKLFVRLRIYYEVRFNNQKINEFKPKLLNTNTSEIFLL